MYGYSIPVLRPFSRLGKLRPVFGGRLFHAASVVVVLILSATSYLIGESSAQTAQPRKNLPEMLKGHGGPVKSIRLDETRKRALSSSFDYSIILWQLEGKDGKIIHRMIGHNAAVNDVAFIPDKTGEKDRAVSVSDDGSLGIWDLKTGKLIKMIEDTPDKVIDVEVSGDGKFAATARWDGTARIYDLETNQQIHKFEGHRGYVNAVAFSKDSKMLFTASYDGDIRAWHIGTPPKGSPIQQGSIIHSHGWGLNVLALMPDGERLLFGSLNGVVGLLNVKKREVKEVGSFQHPVLSLAVNQTSSWFATGTGDGHIRIFDNKNLKLIEDYKDFYGPVWGLSFSENGKRIYRAGLDDFIGHWQVQPRKGFEKTQSKFPRRFQVKKSDDPGAIEFRRKCSVCHTLIPDDKNRAGPTLYKLFGRKAGTVKGYTYSKALLESELIWNAETIGRLFDEGPDIVTPGTKMPIQRLKSVERRDALISYLKKATEPETEN